MSQTLANASLSLVLRPGVLIARVCPDVLEQFDLFVEELEQTMVDDGVQKLVLDLHQISSIPSEALTVLNAFHARLRASQGWVRLSNVGASAQQALRSAGATLHVCRSLAEAIG